MKLSAYMRGKCGGSGAGSAATYIQFMRFPMLRGSQIALGKELDLPVIREKGKMQLNLRI